MTIDEAFAVTARELRLKANMSQTEVADSIGVSRQTIWEMETARTSTKLITLQALSNLYQVHLSDIMMRIAIIYEDSKL